MAEDRTPDPADQPEDDKTPPEGNPPEPYRLGGSGGSGKSPTTDPVSGDEPANPFEAFFSSLSGGDMNALAANCRAPLRCSAAPARCSRAVQPMPGRG